MAPSKHKAAGNDLGLRNVLITRFGALGNVVMTIPVVYSACRCYPDVKFIMVTRQPFTDLYVNAPENLTVVGISPEDHNGIRGAWRWMSEMCNRYQIDAYIDLQNDSMTQMAGWWCKLHNIKVVHFNKAMHNKRELTRKSNKVMLPLISSRARYRETFFKAGLTIEENFDTLYSPSPKASAEAFAPITSMPKAEGDKWIGIAPFAAHPEKEYPIAQMKEVLEMLSALPNVHIFIFGGTERETEIAQRWSNTFKSVTSLAGKHYGFPAEMALVSNLDVMLTMDSANMHIAAIVGTPTVSVWGATHHYCGFKGWHQSENDMVQVPLSCRPCSIKGDKECYRHDLLCLKAIRPEIIYNKILEKLQ